MALQPLSFKLLWDVATMGGCQWTKTVVLTPTWGNQKTQILEVQKCLEHGVFFFLELRANFLISASQYPIGSVL